MAGSAAMGETSGAGEFRIATFEADITVPIGHACMGGGVQDAREIVDPLLARGFALLGAGQPIVVAALDWCQCNNDSYDRWRDGYEDDYCWVKPGTEQLILDAFAEAAGPTPKTIRQAIPAIPVYGGIACTRGSSQKNLSADEYRKAAAQLLKQGADGIYLFNFFTSREQGKDAYEPPFEMRRDLGVSP